MVLITSEKNLAKKLKASFLKSQLKVFPDGESKITIGSKPKKSTIIVVQSTYPPVDSNLMQALSLIFKAKQHSSTVIAVIPYMGYARQDKEFLPGEVVTMQIISKLFKAVGASKIVVVDIHSKIALNQLKSYLRCIKTTLIRVGLSLNRIVKRISNRFGANKKSTSH